MVGHPILGDKRYHHGWAAEKKRLAQPEQVAGGHEADSHQQHGDGSMASAQEAASDGSGWDPNEDQAAGGLDEESASEAGDAGCHDGGASARRDGDSAAAADSAGGGHLCLWAVQVQLQHPVTLEHLNICIPEPDAYAALRADHTGLRQKRKQLNV